MNEKLPPRPLKYLQCDGTGEDNGFYFKKPKIKYPDGPVEPSQLPIPEAPFIKYGQTADQYLKSGKYDANLLKTALIRQGVDPENGPGNILELGCANARVLRWLSEWGYNHEAWGVDLDAPMIFWCHQYLSPPFHFAVSSTAPHLFFEDQFFSLVFCMSIFTHIDDMYLSWIAELRRVTKTGGFVYITVHDENTRRLQEERNAHHLNKRMESPAYQEFIKNDGDFCACGRDWQSLVSFKREYLTDLFSRYFDVVEIIEGAMAKAQTGLLLRRR